MHYTVAESLIFALAYAPLTSTIRNSLLLQRRLRSTSLRFVTVIELKSIILAYTRITLFLDRVLTEYVTIIHRSTKYTPTIIRVLAWNLEFREFLSLVGGESAPAIHFLPYPS